MIRPTLLIFLLSITSAFIRCSERSASDRSLLGQAGPRPSILLITLDTTRADAIGPETRGGETPAFNALALRGKRFRFAYATAPETLPSHSSIMTGIYPAAHGVHENARYLGGSHALLAERLRSAGYETAAFVSAFPLDRRFGLARGFDIYEDEFGAGRSERPASETTDRALSHLVRARPGPLFLWIHYYDPHYPYEPPDPFRTRYPDNPYQGEVASMDQEMGRIIKAFQLRSGRSAAVVVTGDHGESLGEHGESQHGHLLYEGAMRVPLVVSGPGVTPSVSNEPVSNRRVFHTILDWAGLGNVNSLLRNEREVVLGEAMKPFLSYGWQPQMMAIEGRHKAIRAGRVEVYDVVADPSETRDLGSEAALSRELRQALRDYPIPSVELAPAAEELDDEARRQLASLGYVASSTKPVVRKDAPRPRDMVHLFVALDRASGLFVQEEYAAAIPLFEEILAADPDNLMTALRLAAAHSALGHGQRAIAAFRAAEAIAPDSPDVRHYLALHYIRSGEWQRAVPLLEKVLADDPHRLPALEAMAMIRERQGRPDEALRLWQRIHSKKTPIPAELIHVGELAMAAGNTPIALRSFEQARELSRNDFSHDLELGVLYLDARKLEEARSALDRVPSTHPGYSMALFKRAQVSVLLNEPDRAARIESARTHADSDTRPLIESERLFQGSRQ